MIGIDELLYDLDFRLNKIATGRHQGIAVEDKIIAINNAQLILLKRKISLNNVYQAGLDSFLKRYQDLQQFIVTNEELHLNRSENNIFIGDLTKKPNLLMYIKSWVLASKGECKDVIIDLTLIPHADVRQWLANTELCPSFEYQESFCCLSSDKIEVYTDGSFEPSKALLTYLRYPVLVDAAGYIHFDGTESTDINCEMPAFLKDELLDIATLEISIPTENIPATELTNQRIKTNE